MDDQAMNDSVVAAFDVDGTLTTRDCVVPFLVRVAGWRRLAVLALRRPLLLGATALGRGDRDRVKAIFVGGAVAGRDRAGLDTEGRRFAAEVARRWVRADTLARLRWHQASGHEVVLVSASLRSYLEPLAAHLGGIAAVLCTDVETGPDGRCTGRLAGGNCRGAEKSRRLRSHLGNRQVRLWAYGDSAGDAELLAMADHAVRVDRVVIDAVPAEVGPS